MIRLLIAIFVLALVASCSPPPRGRTAPEPGGQAAAQPEATSKPQDERYEFEKEGEFPESPDDVAFEEDRLPPAPEEVGSSTLSEAPIASEGVAEESLPAPGDGIQPGVTTPVKPQVTTPVPHGSQAEVVRGFRVQLLAVTERPRAEELAREAGQRLGVRTHVVAEGSQFKVRAGDFTDRADAVRLKERATSLGYDGCWVVTDQVELRR